VRNHLGRAECRRTWAERNPALVIKAKALHGTGRRPDRSLGEIAAELATDGDVGPRGLPFTASSIRQTLA
jgi:hypothetical protein